MDKDHEIEVHERLARLEESVHHVDKKLDKVLNVVPIIESNRTSISFIFKYLFPASFLTIMGGIAASHFT